ncbi:MAG: response regulator, partial [bacterium]
MPRPTLLVIDDDPMELSLVEEYLKAKGDYEVIAETDPRLGLARLAQMPVDLVLCDWRLPELSGIEFLEEVKRQNGDLPVVIFSG